MIRLMQPHEAYLATEHQWSMVRAWDEQDPDGIGYLDSCVLELLDRIQILEAQVQKLQQVINN